MTTYARRLMTGLILLTLVSSAVNAQMPRRPRIEVPPVPSNLQVPEGHTVYLKGYATGTQNYMCLPSLAGPAWKLVGPQATLFQERRGDLYQQVTTHFLAPNPFEGGTARPSWQHSFDSSQVWGRALASSADADFVEVGAIPWLLVEIVGAQRGPAAGGLLAQTTFIQRLNTSGGAAPATCTDIGAFVMVPYSTDYFFYRASRKR